MDEIGRRRALSLGATAIATLGGCSQAASLEADEPGGTEQPAITLETLDVGGSPGDSIRVQQPGTVTLLDFFATWCEPCKPQMAELGTVDEAFPDVHLLSITWENEAEPVREFWQDYDGTWPVVMDTRLKTGQRYDVNNLPTLVLLDAAGAEVWRHTGPGPAEAATIESKIEAARS